MAKASKLDRKQADKLLAQARDFQKKHKKKLDEAQQKQLEDAITALIIKVEKESPCSKEQRQLEQLIQTFSADTSGGWFEQVRVIPIAVAVALLLRTFVVEPFKIPSGSMIPTLAIGDHIFVNKLSYGLWIPFSQKKLRFGAGPQRGDVIVFINPTDRSRDMIKRVIGLPGDVIMVKNNALYINQKPIAQLKKRPFTYKDRDDEKSPWSQQQAVLYQEKLAGRTYNTLRHPDSPSPLKDWNATLDARRINRPWGPQVKPGFVFVMGDNRDRSSDSRDWGLVPIKNIKGRAVLIWLSYGGGEGFQWNRIFTPIR